MDKCVKDYTVIYSQPSVDALDELIKVFFWETQGISHNIDDIYYYGVFCKPQNYVNFHFCSTEDYDFEIPNELSNVCLSNNQRIDFVKRIIRQIMHKEIEKPEWMKYIELHMECNEYGMPPSTFLYLEAKDQKYALITEKLIEFLYSPNILMTMVNA